MKTTKIGVIGCGAISYAYLTAGDRFEILEVVACADLYPERARAKAEEFSIPRACTVEELLADPEIEIVVNLTIPRVHAEIALATLAAGKCAYSEKPLGVTREQGQAVLKLAADKGLLVGCAPDTFLGGGIQTCRKLIDDGWIGDPVAATAFMLGHGPEHWHADPDFFYQPGAGPLFDMGPYYLTTLTHLLGPTRRVAGSATITFPERLITSKPHYGTVIQVNTPTHVAGLMEFATGAIGTLVMSHDVWAAQVPCIEVYGTEGTLSVPDPNTFGGPIRVKRGRAEAWAEIPFSHGYTDPNRGIGVADMAYAMRSGRAHRASGRLAYHVLDVMQAFYDASEQKTWVDLASDCPRPEPFPLGLRAGTLDD